MQNIDIAHCTDRFSVLAAIAMFSTAILHLTNKGIYKFGLKLKPFTTNDNASAFFQI